MKNTRTLVMAFTKGEKCFNVHDNGDSWNIKRTEGKMSINYKIPKTMYKTANGVERFIRNSDMF